MKQYFTSHESGNRYNKYRPKVHDVIIDWLETCCPARRFEKGIDIACGTGDSLKPLLQLCNDVTGIDSSEEMLSIALRHGLPVAKGDYRGIAGLGTFDLLSTCMAFHWFDPDLAFTAYKAASNDGAIWLIYNFALGGHQTSASFNEWYFETYMKEHPSPPRNSTTAAIPAKDKSVRLVKQDKGWLPIELTREALVGYLSTQSNIEQAVRSGNSIEDICSDLLLQLSRINFSKNFKYNFSYEIYEYNGN